MSAHSKKKVLKGCSEYFKLFIFAVFKELQKESEFQRKEWFRKQGMASSLQRAYSLKTFVFKAATNDSFAFSLSADNCRETVVVEKSKISTLSTLHCIEFHILIYTFTTAMFVAGPHFIEYLGYEVTPECCVVLKCKVRHSFKDFSCFKF